MKLLFDESLSPKLVSFLSDLFPESESALRNGLAGSGGKRILECACNYPPETAAEALRRNAIRIAELAASQESLILPKR